MPTQASQMLSIASPQAFKGRMLRSSRASTFSAAGAKEISLKMFETWELQRVSSVCLCEGWCDGEAGSTSVLFTSVLFNDNYSWLISFDLYSITTCLSYVRFCIITIIVINILIYFMLCNCLLFILSIFCAQYWIIWYRRTFFTVCCLCVPACTQYCIVVLMYILHAFLLFDFGFYPLYMIIVREYISKNKTCNTINYKQYMYIYIL